MSTKPQYPDKGSINGSYSAFPKQYGSSGLTKRELFAAMAMQGMMADPSVYDIEFAASAAVKAADALLAALAEEAEA